MAEARKRDSNARVSGRQITVDGGNYNETGGSVENVIAPPGHPQGTRYHVIYYIVVVQTDAGWQVHVNSAAGAHPGGAIEMGDPKEPDWVPERRDVILVAIDARLTHCDAIRANTANGVRTHGSDRKAILSGVTVHLVQKVPD